MEFCPCKESWLFFFRLRALRKAWNLTPKIIQCPCLVRSWFKHFFIGSKWGVQAKQSNIFVPSTFLPKPSVLGWVPFWSKKSRWDKNRTKSNKEYQRALPRDWIEIASATYPSGLRTLIGHDRKRAISFPEKHEQLRIRLAHLNKILLDPPHPKSSRSFPKGLEKSAKVFFETFRMTWGNINVMCSTVYV